MYSNALTFMKIKSIYLKLHSETKNLYNVFNKNLFILGLVSIIWFILRTGTKPSRINYPCQKVAKNNSIIWIVHYIFPTIIAIKKRYIKPLSIILSFILIIMTSELFYHNISPILANEYFKIDIDEHISDNLETSSIYVVQNTTGYDDGIVRLFDLMNEYGVKLYKSENENDIKGIDGFIDDDDVVIIKINSQWNQRGGTNTDLIKQLVNAILNHPDSFNGEIIIADNGQGQSGSYGTGGSFNWEYSNAENHSQSIKYVVNEFNDQRVTIYNWQNITELQVEEYVDGDFNDGYIVSQISDPETGLIVSYPKFMTTLGTYISFKYGVWNGTDYLSDKLKIINVPVLKAHGNYYVTGCVKHYMGVVSDKLVNGNAHSSVGNGGMGTELAETRVPVLNILDMIWVNANWRTGPRSYYDQATRLNIIAASTDPVALDYWSSKFVLMPVAEYYGFTPLYVLDPERKVVGSFGYYLEESKNELIYAGYNITNNYDYINVYLHKRPEVRSGLSVGWNLLGVPLNLQDPTITGLFQENLTKIQYIYGFDNTDKKFSYWINGFPDNTQQITTLECGKGYWVYATENLTVTLTGDPGNMTTMTDGWNLIGVHTVYPVTPSEYLNGTGWSEVYGYEDGVWTYCYPQIGGTLMEMAPGEGYWTKTTTP